MATYLSIKPIKADSYGREVEHKKKHEKGCEEHAM